MKTKWLRNLQTLVFEKKHLSAKIQKFLKLYLHGMVEDALRYLLIN